MRLLFTATTLLALRLPLAGLLDVRPPQVPATAIARSDTIVGVLDHLSGDTYFAKYTNSMPDTYRVYYKITDGARLVQDTTSMIVRAKSSNTNGPYHCSSNAILSTIKTEKVE